MALPGAAAGLGLELLLLDAGDGEDEAASAASAPPPSSPSTFSSTSSTWSSGAALTLRRLPLGVDLLAPPPNWLRARVTASMAVGN